MANLFYAILRLTVLGLMTGRLIKNLPLVLTTKFWQLDNLLLPQNFHNLQWIFSMMVGVAFLLWDIGGIVREVKKQEKGNPFRTCLLLYAVGVMGKELAQVRKNPGRLKNALYLQARSFSRGGAYVRKRLNDEKLFWAWGYCIARSLLPVTYAQLRSLTERAYQIFRPRAPFPEPTRAKEGAEPKRVPRPSYPNLRLITKVEPPAPPDPNRALRSIIERLEESEMWLKRLEEAERLPRHDSVKLIYEIRQALSHLTLLERRREPRTSEMPRMDTAAIPKMKPVENGNGRRGMPTRFSWRHVSGEIRYNSQFLRELRKRFPSYERTVMKQLHILAERGPEHSSLKTRPYDGEADVPYTPRPCRVSRVNDKVRFSWKEVDGVLIVYWIFWRSELGLSNAGKKQHR